MANNYNLERIKPIIAQYIPIANMIAKTIGNDCEVVVHDLECPEHSVVYSVNNHVTGRQVGQSFDHLVPQVLLSKKLNEDMVTNYYFRTKDGKLIKSSTTLLKDLNGDVVGAMCINLDTSRITQQIHWLQEMLPGNADFAVPEPAAPEEDLHMQEIVNEMINKIIGSKNVPALHKEDKLDLIRDMDQRGIFLMKGAIDQVSIRMGISKVTVYSYLDEIRGKK